MKCEVSDKKEEVKKLEREIANETSIGALYEKETIRFSYLVRHCTNDPEGVRTKEYLVPSGVSKTTP